MSTQKRKGEFTVRLAREKDLDDIEEMICGFAEGHPAENHARPRSRLRAAYFGDTPVAKLVVATRDDRAIGMAQWTLIYDMFWGMYGANAEWLYVRPEYRGSGVAVAIVAEICAQVRQCGGEFLHGGGDDEAERLYEHVAIGMPTHECHLSGEAFQVLADLAGLAPRDIVRQLPAVDLNRVPARPRT
jgi:GNAT superfamily N-acetyltransferase